MIYMGVLLMRRSTSVAASIIAEIKVLTLTARKEATLIILIEIHVFFVRIQLMTTDKKKAHQSVESFGKAHLSLVYPFHLGGSGHKQAFMTLP